MRHDRRDRDGAWNVSFDKSPRRKEQDRGGWRRLEKEGLHSLPTGVDLDE
jgi:hypothetical protein